LCGEGSIPDDANTPAVLLAKSYPRAAAYDPDWVRGNALGENAICQAEALAQCLSLRPGEAVLDLGCGKATSSIFLAREFGVTCWAVDANTSPTETLNRARDMDCGERLFPLRADAHDLPFAKGFFDAIVAIDSYLYYGTDDRYLGYLVEFLRPGGRLAVADIAFTREIAGPEDAPDFLRAHFGKHWSYVHAIAWWRRHWEKTELVEVDCAEALPESETLLRDYVRNRPPEQDEDAIMRAVPQDHGGLITLFRLVARKR
jgi:cyclopropane fatty-acyl-phospholipid synthase-like methyltransferase